MAHMSTSPLPRLPAALALAASPAVIIFLSSNFVNVGNLAFNMIFSRLMGPELFGTLALLLTIKLALLGVMGAIQMAVSQMVASCTGDERPDVEQALSRINRFLFLGIFFFGIILTTGITLGEAVGARLLPMEPHLLAILLVSVPFGAALSVLRGVAFGDLRTGRIVLSANVEMGVRLVGALLAWGLGLGIEGVVFAISLSIVAGWVVLADLLPAAPTATVVKRYTGHVALAAVPFAFLQLTQVAALDGEIFVANVLLPEKDAGFIAALSLFQRIQFFACFALASVLLPRVVAAVQRDESAFDAALPVFALFGAVSFAVTTSAVIAPELLVTLLVGSAYTPAADALLPAVIAAAFFTFSYLVATLLIALKDMMGISLIVIGAVIQIGAMSLGDPASFCDLITIKAVCQATVAILMCFCVVAKLRMSGSTAS